MKFTYSEKLAKLFERLLDKDKEEVADQVFTCISDEMYLVSEDYNSIFNIIAHANRLDNDYYVVEYNAADPEELVCFLFVRDKNRTETQIYNKLLREWCKQTNRKIKKKS